MKFVNFNACKITNSGNVLKIARNLCITRGCILYAIGIRKTGLRSKTRKLYAFTVQMADCRINP